MANCPNCGTWNPDDKIVCWRCQTELPRPAPKKKAPARIAGLPVWAWAALMLFLTFWIVTQCFVVPGMIGR